MIKKLTLIIILCTLLSGCSNTGATIPSTDETQPTTLSTETTQISTTVEVTTTSGSEISSTLNGVSYKLGEANTQYKASVIKISGTITNPSPEVDSFGGVFEIDGREYHLTYTRGGSNLLSYASKGGYTRTYGQVFMNEDFSEVVIMVIEDGWSSNEGPMLTYPANTKEEALTVANRLMVDFLADMEMEKLK